MGRFQSGEKIRMVDGVWKCKNGKIVTIDRISKKFKNKSERTYKVRRGDSQFIKSRVRVESLLRESHCKKTEILTKNLPK